MDTWSREELADWFAQVAKGRFKDCTQALMQLDGELFAPFTEAQIQQQVPGVLGAALFNTKQQWLTLANAPGASLSASPPATAHLLSNLLVPEEKKQRISFPEHLRGFWDALAHAEEKNGCLILPEGFRWSLGHGRKIFVRECYSLLADAILRDAGLLPLPATSAALGPSIPIQNGNRYWTILGNPGIGKTMFLYYLLWRLRKIPTVSNVVQQVVGRNECYDYGNGQVTARADLPMCEKTGWWFLFDSTAPPIGLQPSVLVTSPKYDIWKQFDRQNNARKFVMPVWSYSELFNCRKECYSNVTEEFVKKAYDRWGGICRYVLAKTSPEDQATLDEAIGSANIDVLKSFAAETLRYSNDMPHTLLYFIVNEQFFVTGVAFASEYVSHEVTWRVVFQIRTDVKRLLVATEGANQFGALRGLLFEEVAHDALQRGGDFTFAPLSDAASTSTSLISIEKSLEKVTFRTAQELATVLKAGTYARPTTSNFAAVDAVLVPSDNSAPVLLLQMTVGSSHPIKAAEVTKLRNELPAALKGRVVKVVFVVPEDIASCFKKQPFHTVQGTVMVNPPNDVSQHVLTVCLETPHK